MKNNSRTNWPRFAVGVFLLLVAVGFAVWGFSITTLSPDQRQILLWILPLASGFSATAFAGSLSVKAKGFWPGLVITATGGFGIWLLTFFFLFPKSNSQSQVSEEIPGTKVTHAQLRECLPFGYVIFYVNGDKMIYEPHPDKRLQWKADWERVTIAPNFSKSPNWYIPKISASMIEDGKSRPVIVDAKMGGPTPMILGKCYPLGGFVVRDQPQIYVGMLGDNQRSPIFVLGFRIAAGDSIEPITVP